MSKKYSDVMVDLETLGLSRVSAPIIQCAMVAFNKDEIGPALDMRFNMATQDDREVEPETAAWWKRQDPEVLKHVFSGSADLNDLPAAIHDFFAEHATPTVRVWAKSPSFDLELLNNLGRQKRRVMPWKYWAERDVRTAEHMVGANTEPNASKHDALADCKHQIVVAQRFLAVALPD